MFWRREGATASNRVNSASHSSSSQAQPLATDSGLAAPVNVDEAAASQPQQSRATCAPSHEHETDPILTANMLKEKQLSTSPEEHQHQHEQQMTFFQHYFTKPIEDSEKNQSQQRQFSFLSLGSVITGIIMLFILFGIIATTVALTVDRAHHKQAATHYTTSPVRLGIPSNFPDPALWYENGTYYAYATNNAAGVIGPEGRARNNTPAFGEANIQMATSTDFIDWKIVDLEDQPLPFTGEWTGTHRHGSEKLTYPRISNTWAPAVIKNNEGKYIMYYTSSLGGSNPYLNKSNPKIWHPQPHCIGAALSSSPTGPFIPQNSSLICPISSGGAIDPSPILDPITKTLYLTYKIDGNNIGRGGECGNTIKPLKPTPIMLQKLSPDGLSLLPSSPPIELLSNIKSDGPLIEAPLLIRSKQGVYFLFFSSGCTRLPTYTTKYATATRIEGPYVRNEGVLLETGDWGLEAPGSVGVVEGGKMVFHARVKFGEVGRVRAMFTVGVEFVGREVRLVDAGMTGE